MAQQSCAHCWLLKPSRSDALELAVLANCRVIPSQLLPRGLVYVRSHSLRGPHRTRTCSLKQGFRLKPLKRLVERFSFVHLRPSESILRLKVEAFATTAWPQVAVEAEPGIEHAVPPNYRVSSQHPSWDYQPGSAHTSELTCFSPYGWLLGRVKTPVLQYTALTCTSNTTTAAVAVSGFIPNPRFWEDIWAAQLKYYSTAQGPLHQLSIAGCIQKSSLSTPQALRAEVERGSE